MKRFYFAILFFSLPALGFAAPTSAVVYDKESHHKTELFRWKRQTEGTPAHTVLRSEFFDLQGNTVAVEEAVTENGKVKSYTVQQYQTNENGKLIVNGN